MSIIDIISDNTNKKLLEVPPQILDMYNLKMLYLNGNYIEVLPGNFFERLCKLTWLDLRQNKLKIVPPGIAYHAFLETFLVQDNEIEELPNEVGLVPNLKVLQIAGNPLKYPPMNVIEKGTESLLLYLKQEYYKSNPDAENCDEEETDVVSYNPIPSNETMKRQRITVQDLLRKTAKKYMLDTYHEPIIQVTGLSKTNVKESSRIIVKTVSPVKKIIKVTRNCSKVSLRSQNQRSVNKRISTIKCANEEELKELWLRKLSKLLLDQEKIIQQEKNLQYLSKWRTEKKMEPPRASLQKLSEVPFAIDPNEKMLNREDLTQQIDDMIKQSKRSNKKYCPKKVDMQKLINEVVSQMKNMEMKINESKTSLISNGKDVAAQQIENIIELHKRIISLQTANAQN